MHLQVDIESTKIQYPPVNAMLHLLVDIESTKIQYRPVNAMLLMKGGGYWEYWNPIPPCKCNVADEYSSSYGIIYGHLLLLANNLLGNNEKYVSINYLPDNKFDSEPHYYKNF